MENQDSVKLFLNLRNNPLEFWKLLTVSHPIRGAISLETHPWHVEMMNNLFQNEKNLLIHARQLGVSTFQNFYALWIALFSSKEVVQIVLPNEAMRNTVKHKLVVMHSRLPREITDLVRVESCSKTEIVFSNMSGIRLQTPQEIMNQKITEAYKAAVILDCFAFVSEVEAQNIYRVVTTANPKSLLICSTPSNNQATFFESLTKPEHKFKVSKYDWRANPNLNEKWAMQHFISLGSRDVNAELYANFTDENCGVEMLRDILVAQSSS